MNSQQYIKFLYIHLDSVNLRVVRTLENNEMKYARIMNQLTFLCKCRQYSVTPKCLKLKWPHNGIRKNDIINQTQKKLLTDLIDFNHKKKETIRKDLVQGWAYMECKYRNTYILDVIIRFLAHQHENEFMKCKTHLQHKFELLIRGTNKYSEPYQAPQQNLRSRPNILSSDIPVPLNTRPGQLDPVKTKVINLSNCDITPTQVLALTKGMKYSVAPTSLPIFDLVSGIEKGLHKLEEDFANQVRCEMYRCIKKENNKRIKPNLSKEEYIAIKQIRENKDLITVEADKGGAIVLMNREEYDSKLKLILEGEDFEELNEDPTTKIERKIYRVLKKYDDIYNAETRSKLTPHHTCAPSIYAKPKVHKQNNPLRIIVNCKDSPTEKLAKFLCKNYLNKISYHTESNIKNSYHFVECLKNMNITGTDTMASFDVEDLFGSVPVRETNEIIMRKLKENENITTRELSGIQELLEIVSSNNYFQHKGKVYRRKEGLPMGNPISPVMSNIFMEELEMTTLNENMTCKPKLYKRYVDDIFLIFDRTDKLNLFFDLCNSQHPRIKFTKEIEKDNQMPFLDVLITRNTPSTIKLSVFRRPTHSDTYVNYNSNCNPSVKKALIKTLKNRAEKICDNQETYEEEKNKVIRALKQNNYPEDYVRKIWNEVKPQQQKPKPITTVAIPYVKNLSERIKRENNKLNIRTVFQSKRKISQLIKTPDLSEERRNKNVIYKISCSHTDCQSGPYIGETKAQLHVRKKQHKYNLQKMIETAELVNHKINADHEIDLNTMNPIEYEKDWFKRKFKESSYMKYTYNKCTISKPSVKVNRIWDPLLSNIYKRKSADSTMPSATTTN
uniref:Reverse transcriptase domain-containing protein n=1 Tax=Cacopsylla melanoneura TaxID=428564 RepID=A0A8D8Y5E7_9HEMI